MVLEQTKVVAGFGINSVPLDYYLKFKNPCKERCGDVHWVRLKELIDKEEELDLLKKQLIERD